MTEATCAGAAAGRTTGWSFTHIPAESTDAINSEIAMLRLLGRLSQLFEGSERREESPTIRSDHEGGRRSDCLGQTDIKQRQPILKGLQSKTAENESDAERAQASFRKVVSVVFKVGIDRHPDARDNPCHQPYTNGKRPSMVHVTDEGAADQGRDHVADRADNRSPELTPREPWTAQRCIVGRRTHAARVRKYLADRDENGKRDGESETQNPVQSSSEAEPADDGKQSFPRQGVMIEPTSRSIELN